MYTFTLVLALICTIGAVIFGRLKIWGLMVLAISIALGSLIYAIESDGERRFVPLERTKCVVQMKSYDKYDLKCAVAFNELIPIVEVDRTTLSGMHIEWNNGDILKSKLGDTIVVYLMADIATKPWSTDTTIYLCANRTKKDVHEYDLFLQYLKKGTKEEAIDKP